VEDEAVLAHPRERVDDLLEWSVGHSRRVQVVKVNVVQAEPARAHVRRVAEVVRVTDGAQVGVLGAAADEPVLGGDDQPFWVRVQGLADELLVGVRARRRGAPGELGRSRAREARAAGRLSASRRRHAQSGSLFNPLQFRVITELVGR
jgi:hypothetical protein